MGIKLSILAHQTECLKRISKVFEGVNLTLSDDVFSKPLFDAHDKTLQKNIKEIQSNCEGTAIPENLRTRVEDNFGIDIRMETGTGKTYCYTRLMYELNKQCGFRQF